MNNKVFNLETLKKYKAILTAHQFSAFIKIHTNIHDLRIVLI